MYFYNYKNNKRTNSKFNKVFAMRRLFNVKFGTVFFSNKLGNIRQDRTIFFLTKSVSDQKIRDFHISDRGAPRIRQRRGAQPRVWGRSSSHKMAPCYPCVRLWYKFGSRPNQNQIFVILVVLRRSVWQIRRTHLRGSVSGLHSSEETS